MSIIFSVQFLSVSKDVDVY